MQRANEERKLTLQHEQTLKKVEDKLASLQERCNELKQTYAKYRPAYQFLDRILASSDEFNGAEEVLTRYNILKQTNVDLQQQSSALQEKHESTLAELQRKRKEQQNVLLMENSDLARLQKRLEDASEHVTATGRKCTEAEDSKNRARLVRSEISQNIHHMFLRVKASRHNKKHAISGLADRDPSKVLSGTRNNSLVLSEEQLEIMLSEIGERIAELEDIVKLK
jgi:hypothetical protein